uniref:Ileal sodium/bile acid cotransporter-like n=1 Tax=Phallusia mammillata TaxID=59560 RepID=A0A6F9DT96_9ASCI|nr:ileal sodium/bile acid cotransporter-like [Phallusia mammillata]
MNTTSFLFTSEPFVTSPQWWESNGFSGWNVSGSGINEVSESGIIDLSGSGSGSEDDRNRTGKAVVPTMAEYCASVDDITVQIPECSSQKQANYSRALSLALIGCVSIVMFAMGCNVQVEKLKTRLVRPWGILIGFLCQFGIMPLCAFVLATLMGLTQAKALVVLIMGCLPGGNASNLIAYWINGDMDLSIAMTATSTMLAFAMMPLCLFIYARAFVDETVVVPYVNICILLAVFIAPVAIGIVINYFKPNVARIISRVGAVIGIFVILAAALIGILLYPSAFHIPTIYWSIGFILPLTGYVLGYALSHLTSKLLGSDVITEKQKRTIAIETGTQNSQLCTTIIQLNYGCTCMILEMYSYPLVYFLYQIVESLLFCVIYQVRCIDFSGFLFTTFCSGHGGKFNCSSFLWGLTGVYHKLGDVTYDDLMFRSQYAIKRVCD